MKVLQNLFDFVDHPNIEVALELHNTTGETCIILLHWRRWRWLGVASNFLRPVHLLQRWLHLKCQLPLKVRVISFLDTLKQATVLSVLALELAAKE